MRFQGIYNIPTIKYWSGLPAYVFNKDALKVRLNPDMDAPILCLLPLNNEVYVDRKFVRAGNEWMHILGPEIYLNKGASLCGYVKAEFLDFTECEINPTE